MIEARPKRVMPKDKADFYFSVIDYIATSDSYDHCREYIAHVSQRIKPEWKDWFEMVASAHANRLWKGVA